MKSTLFRAPEEIMWRNADFVLRQNETEGMRIFVRDWDEKKYQDIVDFLYQYPIAKMAFLEYLVNGKILKVMSLMS